MQKKEAKKQQILRGLGYGLAAAIIFLSGWGIGSNRLVLSRNQLFHKSVQKNLPANLNYTSVEQVFDTLKRDYDGQLDQQKLLDGLKAGLAGATGDPYTEYFNQKDAQQFNEELNGTFEGIGAELGKDDNKNVIVVAPISGTPADKAGLKPKDIIAQVDGNSAFDMTVDAAKSKIRGPKGTHVKLKIVRDGKPLDIDIVRDTITVPSVTSKVLDGNVGYIKISRFGDDTAAATMKAAQDLKSKNVKAMVLDLRSDPGGRLDAAVSVGSLWLDAGKTVLQERRDNVVVNTYQASGNPILKGLPTVVLIDEGSASASEITAGALHDNGAAKLIGAKSFGKGSVQQLENLVDGGILKVTIARWYTPNGKNIDKQGIEPDQKVSISDADAKAGHDTQLEAATASLR